MQELFLLESFAVDLTKDRSFSSSYYSKIVHNTNHNNIYWSRGWWWYQGILRYQSKGCRLSLFSASKLCLGRPELLLSTCITDSYVFSRKSLTMVHNDAWTKVQVHSKGRFCFVFLLCRDKATGLLDPRSCQLEHFLTPNVLKSVIPAINPKRRKKKTTEEPVFRLQKVLSISGYK